MRMYCSVTSTLPYLYLCSLAHALALAVVQPASRLKSNDCTSIGSRLRASELFGYGCSPGRPAVRLLCRDSLRSAMRSS